MRSKVWLPEEPPGKRYSSIGFEGRVPKAVAEFLVAAQFHGSKLSPEMERRIELLTAELITGQRKRPEHA